MTYARDLIEVARLVYLQNFDCNLPPMVVTLVHLGIPTTSQRVIHRIVARWNLHGPRKQALGTTYLTQSGETLLAERRSQNIQHLFNIMKKVRPSQ